MSTPHREFVKPSLAERFLNRLFGLLVGWGFGPHYNYLLQVQGRKTGRIYSTPINLIDHDGKRFLVAPRGETQWVRNARVSAEVWLKKGRSRQRFGLRPLNDADKPEVLKQYLDRYRSVVQRYFTIPAGSPIQAFSAIAPEYPVFELNPK